MGVIVNKQDNNDELSRRINADLRAKALETAGQGDDEVDFVEDSEYMENLKKSSSKLSWMWIPLILLALASVLYIIFM